MRIFHNGKAVPADPWDTVASALWRAGVRIFSRSVKFHRPRGLFCGIGKCGNCMMRIDGAPNVRACTTPVRDGLRVEDQNAIPSARYDALSVLQFLPPWFDPQRSVTPGLFRPWFHRAVRQMAGWGTLPEPSEPLRRDETPLDPCAVLVVGGGPSGLAASIALAGSGRDVVLADDGPRLGGRLVREEPELGRDLVSEARRAGVRLLTPATVAGIYPDGEAAVVTPDRLRRLKPGSVILATGAPEAGLLFRDNDLPGVMTVSCALELLSRGLSPGTRVVVVGGGEREQLLARKLEGKAQVSLLTPERPSPASGAVRGELAMASGWGRVRAAIVQMGPRTKRVPADAICVGTTRRPAIELAQQAGAVVVEREGVLVPRVAPDGACAPGVFACGDLAAPGTIPEAIASGERVARGVEEAGRAGAAEVRGLAIRA